MISLISNSGTQQYRNKVGWKLIPSYWVNIIILVVRIFFPSPGTLWEEMIFSSKSASSAPVCTHASSLSRSTFLLASLETDANRLPAPALIYLCGAQQGHSEVRADVLLTAPA